jgi:hypothetical protein
MTDDPVRQNGEDHPEMNHEDLHHAGHLDGGGRLCGALLSKLPERCLL